jgi:hypothetical protein
MTRIATARRPLPLALAGLGAAAVLLLLLLLSPQHSPAATAMSVQPLSPKAAALTQAMDKLWEEHVAWTRMAIVGFAADLPGLKATETRLLRNQVDIGNAIKPYYGAAAGAKLTALLKTHILEAVTVLADAKAGDKPKLNAALKAWYGNAHQIAAFLSKANPKSWPLQATASMMNEHLKLTTQEAVDELGGKWAASVADYDKIENEILMMASTLASGIVEQFPARFS